MSINKRDVYAGYDGDGPLQGHLFGQRADGRVARGRERLGRHSDAPETHHLAHELLGQRGRAPHHQQLAHIRIREASVQGRRLGRDSADRAVGVLRRPATAAARQGDLARVRDSRQGARGGRPELGAVHAAAVCHHFSLDREREHALLSRVCACAGRRRHGAGQASHGGLLRSREDERRCRERGKR